MPSRTTSWSSGRNPSRTDWRLGSITRGVAMIFFEPQQRDKALFPHDPFKALVVPRPIGWIATMSAKGELNLAPYSYFNAFSSNPPIVGFSSEGEKDSSAFAVETGEFVWSMATWDLRDPMNASAAS